jgi:hypothetical protein
MLYGKIYGVWKIETAKAYVKEFKEVSKPLIKKPWSKLIDLSNWKIVYPEVIQIVGDLNKWCRENNMEWTIYIINQKAGYNQLMKIFEAGKFADIGKTFRTKAEAEKFLIENGYRIKPDEKEIFK